MKAARAGANDLERHSHKKGAGGVTIGPWVDPKKQRLGPSLIGRIRPTSLEKYNLKGYAFSRFKNSAEEKNLQSGKKSPSRRRERFAFLDDDLFARRESNLGGDP